MTTAPSSRSSSARSSAPRRLVSRGPRARWDTSARAESVDRSLASEAGVSPVAARVLRGRGYESPSAVRSFLAAHGAVHDPWLLPDMERAVARLARRC
jgi:hypothetical protein